MLCYAMPCIILELQQSNAIGTEYRYRYRYSTVGAGRYRYTVRGTPALFCGATASCNCNRAAQYTSLLATGQEYSYSCGTVSIYE